MSMAKNVTIVLGSARKNRNSERVFRALVEHFEAASDVVAVAVDVRDHIETAETIPPWGEGGADEHPTKWKKIVKETDAFVFVLPEYNHGYPGEWKLLMDSLFDEYDGKTAYIVGVSKGSFSGVRVADHVKPILVELHFTVTRGGLYVGKVTEVLGEDGAVLNEALKERMQKFVDRVAKEG